MSKATRPVARGVPRYLAGRVGPEVDREAEPTICPHPKCEAPSDEASEAGLCRPHLFGAWKDVQRMITEKIGGRPVVTPKQLLNARIRMANPSRGTVYALKFRDRIKIGFSARVAIRFKSIPHDEVLMTIPGSPEVERDLHAKFDHLRVQGEWFRAEDELIQHLANLRAEHESM